MTSGYREFRYIVIDEATQTVDYWGRTNMLHPQSMAYDYSTNTMYAVAYASQSNSKYAIYSVDIDTGDLTMIAELSENVTEIAVSRDGKFTAFWLIQSMKLIRLPVKLRDCSTFRRRMDTVRYLGRLSAIFRRACFMYSMNPEPIHRAISIIIYTK